MAWSWPAAIPSAASPGSDSDSAPCATSPSPSATSSSVTAMGWSVRLRAVPGRTMTTTTTSWTKGRPRPRCRRLLSPPPRLELAVLVVPLPVAAALPRRRPMPPRIRMAKMERAVQQPTRPAARSRSPARNPICVPVPRLLPPSQRPWVVRSTSALARLGRPRPAIPTWIGRMATTATPPTTVDLPSIMPCPGLLMPWKDSSLRTTIPVSTPMATMLPPVLVWPVPTAIRPTTAPRDHIIIRCITSLLTVPPSLLAWAPHPQVVIIPVVLRTTLPTRPNTSPQGMPPVPSVACRRITGVTTVVAAALAPRPIPSPTMSSTHRSPNTVSCVSAARSESGFSCTGPARVRQIRRPPTIGSISVWRTPSPWVTALF
mmetsp:Transcript_34759/g.102171  ORF Transcript_34759/g.102171 Transcript_34759/m.102171 type:complete len:373 (+) Transcript_34759:1375-2493(+)